MKRMIRCLLLGVVLSGVLPAARAALSLPLALDQTAPFWNLQSFRGVPIGTTTNVYGSDGRMTLVNESYGSYNPPTTNQFQSFQGFGGSIGLVQADWLARSNSTYLKGSNAFSATVAVQMKLPVGTDTGGNIVMVFRQVQVGVPYLSKQVSCLFGSIVAVPSTDESGVALTNVVSTSYWLPEPFSSSGHTNDPYYWSPNAREVYAVQAGPITITWRKATPYTAANKPAYTNLLGSVSFETNGGNIYILYTANYQVSGSPCKPTRKMYWTEGGFAATGKTVPLSGRVSATKVVYNSSVPEFVASNEVVAVSTPEVFIAGLTDRTFWYDSSGSAFHARNREGRLFVELLGDMRVDGRSRVQLGYELVDLLREPTPADVTVYLGERLVPPAPGVLSDLTPSLPTDYTSRSFAYQNVVQGADITAAVGELYAAKETQNLNDFQMHWLETGLEGLQWPSLYGRYAMIWPPDASRYVHYVRTAAATEAEAMATGIQFDMLKAPSIQYQDPLDQPRGKMSPASKYYTWLDAAHPAHRALVRFISGNAVAFERIFSWLDVNLKTPSTFAGDIVATNLSAWNATNYTFNWPEPLAAPRIITQTVNVGDRILAPDGELGGLTNYLAGHINPALGTSYHPGDYVDPLASGFAAASLGAIIPVNAIPGQNYLEVWWFRKDNGNAGPNAGNTQLGFTNICWPSVIGRYTIQWPSAAPEIVLASKLGSGTLDSYQAAGSIYYQNDSALPGYNPNEEHAVMSGGMAFATRDDLNITNTAGYSSHPFVLLDYMSNGLPCLAVFKVLREKPEAGYVFDYMVSAGTVLQPPPPLMFLAKPVEGSGGSATNYNSERSADTGDLPGGWTTNSASGMFGYYNRFTYEDRQNNFWVYRGPHAGLPVLAAGTYLSQSNRFVTLSNATAVAGSAFSLTLHASRQSEFLQMNAAGLPSWLSLSGLSLSGTPGTNAVGTNTIQLVVQDTQDYTTVTNTLVLRVAANGTAQTQGPLAIVCSNQYSGRVTVYSNRAPFLAVSPTTSNSFTMRFYYKTEPSFAWPGAASPPAAGSIVPYLRPVTNSSTYVGAGSSKTDPALDIVYRPYWPERDPSDASKPVPILPYAYTLTKAVSSPAILPGIRDWKTARVLYQQSVASNIVNVKVSVQLFDATRRKTCALGAKDLAKLPGGVNTEYYQGKYYFPNIPPHLGQRVYFDPNLGTNGSLVLVGAMVNETMGDSYVLLNVLRDSDLASVKGLCPSGDADYSKWTNLVNGLQTTMQTFYENPAAPGSYIANTNLDYPIGVGELAYIKNDTGDNTAVDSYALSAVGPGGGYVTLLENSGSAFTLAGDPVAMHIIRVGGSLVNGSVKVMAADNPLSELTTFQHTLDLAGCFSDYEYEWKIAAPVDGVPPVTDATMSRYLALVSGTNLPRYVLGGAGVQALGDNYLVMRYRPKNTSHPLYNQWSDWTAPQLAEGWIKRVLAGINPFNQRAKDIFNNAVNTDVSMLTQAGKRWEGDIALNLSTINNYGLIEIYETVLRRGRMLSIESGYNYGPANDALLLAAGYLSDLYMMIGNEGWADAANPTIGIGTADHTYGDIATALFAFKGQEPSLLEEELALLRGRDDFLQPGVQVSPVYNRLVWNYTRGIDAGEVIYALNYNIQPAPNNNTAIIGAADAAYMYPQGHGDTYGHYLTALKGYYSLLVNSCFDWVPRSEAVLVLGQPVQVDYQDERKFAMAAAAVARAGQQVFDLTWRRDYQQVRSAGWSQFGYVHVNPRQSYTNTLGVATNTASCWGMDHWATRTGQGGYINWLVGNAILPDVDHNSNHTGIQVVDRTTVPELTELVSLAKALQTDLDNAEGGLSPLGIPQDAIAFDINPSAVVGTEGGTHFEQVYQRAKTALNNAVAAFDDAKSVTALMRSEQDSLTGLQNSVANQERAYNSSLIELYGTPYADDMGAGKTYSQDYSGPDLLHFAYVQLPESTFNGLLDPTVPQTNYVDRQDYPANWATKMYSFADWLTMSYNPTYQTNTSLSVKFVLGPHGFFDKPTTWTGKRSSPGRIQQKISELIASHDRLAQTLGDAEGAKKDLDKAINAFNATVEVITMNTRIDLSLRAQDEVLQGVLFASETLSKVLQGQKDQVQNIMAALSEGIPKLAIFGTANGSEPGAPVKASMLAISAVAGSLLNFLDIAQTTIASAAQAVNTTIHRWSEFGMEQNTRDMDQKNNLLAVASGLSTVQGYLPQINARLREFDDAQRAYQAALAEGDRILAERTAYRAHVAQVIQGYRTRDAGFRIFRNEKLERYKTLFDLAARYSLLAANAYDYETGLLNTSAGQAYLARIINSRALGVVRNGEPQYAGSDTGDPGLSSALAEMKADWDVLRGRLGFNNPDAYGTTASLRTEALRILSGTDGDSMWKDTLQAARVSDILADSDVRRYCMQVDDGSGLAVPGIILTFNTTIARGYNLFGQPLASGDHYYSDSSFATKIFGVGVAFVGYKGMENPSTTGTSPSDPGSGFLDPLGLASTPYIYLIPVGVDSMRSPPLGDASTVRTWSVNDVAIPMPFNIGASDFSTKQLWQSSDSLTEAIFALRKHQAFRPVSDTSVFSPSLYGDTGSLRRSQFTNNRLVGRSVWNSKWKLVIPGYSLLNDPKEGLDRFVQTVTDVELHFVTYSYSGN